MALGGEAGARLAGELGLAVSPETLLRRVGGLDDAEPAAPVRYIGIDDWAWRKGRSYGTIVVDLERGRVIDLLPDREEATVRRWLADHPGIELVSRDRASAHSQAASTAAPEARQVADRWHLLKNPREAIERLFEREHEATAAARAATGSEAEAAPEPTATAPSDPTPAETRVGAPPTGHRQQAHRSRARMTRWERRTSRRPFSGVGRFQTIESGSVSGDR